MKTSTKLIRWASAIVIVGALLFNVSLINVKAGPTATVCHCTGHDADEECSITLTISQRAFDKHIAHGDTPGACQ